MQRIQYITNNPDISYMIIIQPLDKNFPQSPDKQVDIYVLNKQDNSSKNVGALAIVEERMAINTSLYNNLPISEWVNMANVVQTALNHITGTKPVLKGDMTISIRLD